MGNHAIISSVSSPSAGSAGTKDEDLTQLLKEEESQISDKILLLRKDVRRTQNRVQICPKISITFSTNSWIPLCLQLIKALVPTDPLDSSDILLEVVSGRTTGGMKEYKHMLENNQIVLYFTP